MQTHRDSVQQYMKSRGPRYRFQLMSKSTGRSDSLWLAAYFLSRRTVRPASGGRTKPPSVLGCVKWADAYDRFYDACGQGRTRQQFRNTLKNARDLFDSHLPSGRIGWLNKDGSPGNLTSIASEIWERWSDRSVEQLDEAALDLSFQGRVEAVSERFMPRGLDPAPATVDSVLVSATPARDRSEASGSRSLRRSAVSKQIGDAAELIVKNHLERSLAADTRQTLIHLAAIGETPGYDLRYGSEESFVAVEVKGTTGPSMQAFELTRNEMRAAEQLGDRYHLYLVANVGTAQPKLQQLSDIAGLLRSGAFESEPLAYSIRQLPPAPNLL